MKKLLLTTLLLLATQVFASSNTYSTTTGKMLVPNVIVDGVYFSNVALTLKANTRWTVDAATQGLNLDNAEWPMVSFANSTSTATFPMLDVDDVPMQNITLVLSPDGSWSSNLPQTAMPSVPVPTSTPTPTPAYNFAGNWYTPQIPGMTGVVTQEGNTVTTTITYAGKTTTAISNLGNIVISESGTINAAGATLGFTVTVLSDSHLQMIQNSCVPSPGYYCKFTNGTVLADFYKR